MGKLSISIAILLCGFMAVSAQTCSSLDASASGGWRPIMTAPRDGRVVELLETYGIAPWYGLFRWGSMDGEKPEWIETDRPNLFVGEDKCLFWRPYKATGKYVDPTNGAQYTVEYQCRWMGRPYNPRTKSCK
jgi:hypothetical protein